VDRKFAVEGVDAVTPLARAAPLMLLAKARPLFALEDAARSGADADAVHDMRVASRRLREALRLLAPVYPDRAFRRWYRRVRSITRALGPVRDADVFIEEFSALAPELGEGGRRAVAYMVGYRTGRRERELEALNRELAALDLARARSSFERMAWSVADSEAARRPLADFAYAAVAERVGVVAAAQPAALVESEVDVQHALRIDYKRLRYAVEAFAPCYQEAFDGLHATLTAFQDVLGELHDLHLFGDLLREPATVSAAAAAGVSASDLGEVATLLDSRANERFTSFTTLVLAHPAPALRQALLTPLTPSLSPESEESPAMVYDELPVIAPVIVGDTPWETGWDVPEAEPMREQRSDADQGSEGGQMLL